VKSVDFHDQDSKLIFLALCVEERLSETLGKKCAVWEVSGQIMGSEMLQPLVRYFALAPYLCLL
jgi:hypothetical protein